ncbi:hypothetical protein PENARI_c102G04953, partial [Penicillium arizonense]
MSPRNPSGWPEWEEKIWCPGWMLIERCLWKARSDTYYDQYWVDRSVESLQGKKYHILRKQRRTGAKSSQNPGKPKRAGVVRRSVVDSASQSNLSAKTPAQRNIDKWFQTILAADPNLPDGSKNPTQTNPISEDVPKSKDSSTMVVPLEQARLHIFILVMQNQEDFIGVVMWP